MRIVKLVKRKDQTQPHKADINKLIKLWLKPDGKTK